MTGTVINWGEVEVTQISISKLKKAKSGDAGNGISSIVKTSGTGAAEPTEHLRSSYKWQQRRVYNGSNDETGDMYVDDTSQDGKVNAAQIQQTAYRGMVFRISLQHYSSAHNH